jgi:3-methyladenine DNA glycosylase/8-oxoguanine DNA glycosylase
VDPGQQALAAGVDGRVASLAQNGRVHPDATATWPVPEPYDFFATVRTLRTGPRDPTLRLEDDGLWRSVHTAEGPATVRLTIGSALTAAAWGPGARAVMADVPHWVGVLEPLWELPAHPVVDRLHRQFRGLRATDTRDVFEALVVTVLQQLVTWEEAAHAWRRLCYARGGPAPGPARLQLPPLPKAIRAAGTATLQGLGVLPRQARTLMEVAFVAHALVRARDLSTEAAVALLQHVKGVGPWTANTALGDRLGRPDPIPTGDFHLPHTVAWALAGEPRGSDERMTELLAPFAGQAYRVIRLITAAGIAAPKRGPRQPLRQWQQGA